MPLIIKGIFKMTRALLLFIFATFLNCSQHLNVIKAEKNKHESVLRKGENYTDYTLTFKAKNEFHFTEIKINDALLKDTVFIKNPNNQLAYVK